MKLGVPRPCEGSGYQQNAAKDPKERTNSDRVPPCPGREALGATAGVAAGGNVVEHAGVRVEPRVEEPEGRVAGSDELVVEQANDAREDGGRARGAVDTLGGSTGDDLHVLALCRDIGVSAAGGVEEALVGGALRCQEGGDGGGLVVGG